jgi:hypothetical protein
MDTARTHDHAKKNSELHVDLHAWDMRVLRHRVDELKKGA